MRTTRAHRLLGATVLHVLRCSNLVWCRRSAERLGYGARTLTAALLFLPLAATACPIGWIPSPNTGTCFLVPPERSTSLFRCVNLCNKHGGAPACIGSAEENAFVTAELAASGGLWLGLYQNETGLGPANGWGRCVVGDAPSFTNWSEGQPDHYHGYQQDCAWVDAGTGQWRALACDGGVRFDPLPWRIAKLSCLCADGNASGAFANDRKALEATSGYNRKLLTRRTATAFSIAAALALLPTLLLLGRTGWRRLEAGRRNLALTSSGGGDSQHALGPAVKGKLRAARALAAGRRLRVSFAMAQAGWAIYVTSPTPLAMEWAGLSIKAAVGDQHWWLVPFPLGANLLTLALFPTDARAIRVVCAGFFIVSAVFGAFLPVAILAGNRSAALGLPISALAFAAAAVLAPTLRCGDRAMQPRPALRRIWAAGRLFFLGNGVFLAGHSIADFVQGVNLYDNWARATLSVTQILCATLFTPRNRGRIHRRLGRLGGRGTEAEEAAAVAALVGGSNADATLERAVKLLRCLPASRLHAADLADSTAASLAGPTLHARTEPAVMGEVTAFLSHSWRDEDEVPGAKYALVSRWASLRQETTGIEPTLWLVALAPTLTTPEPRTACTPAEIICAVFRTGQGVHRPERHPAVARLLARLSRGLPDAARRGRAHVLLKAVVRHGALHVRSE